MRYGEFQPPKQTTLGTVNGPKLNEHEDKTYKAALQGNQFQVVVLGLASIPLCPSHRVVE